MYNWYLNTFLYFQREYANIVNIEYNMKFLLPIKLGLGLLTEKFAIKYA